ncbi:MAG: transposase [Candidatus Omnitrophota bacterium]|nr:MAG: transposase [Candidatus Omnitrophota bacterium]
MPKPELINGEIYHIYNKGTEDRKIFLKDSDYFRFIHDLFEFNNKEAAVNTNRFFYKRHKSQTVRMPEIKRRKRNLIIEILAFCLMPNHFHLMIKQKVENGISKFMQKLGTGYTMYFNTRYERKGVLFQSKYKIKLLSSEEHFIYLPHYIHLNPLDLIGIKWREGKVDNPEKAAEFLESYRWSSYLDYIEKKNFPSVTQREFLLKVFGGRQEYKQSIYGWLKMMELARVEKAIIA